MANGTATALQRKNSQQHDEYNALPPSLDDKCEKIEFIARLIFHY